MKELDSKGVLASLRDSKNEFAVIPGHFYETHPDWALAEFSPATFLDSDEVIAQRYDVSVWEREREAQVQRL